MFHRRLSLRLLAPTVLVSVVLVAACCFGALYFNHLTAKFSAVLSENVRSVRVATGLETATKELIRLFRQPGAQSQSSIYEQNQVLLGLLPEADDLANHEGEIHLVSVIRDGLNEYLNRWDRRQLNSSSKDNNLALADYLEKNILNPCVALRAYNAAQVEISDRENWAIVQKLEWGLIAVGLGGP